MTPAEFEDGVSGRGCVDPSVIFLEHELPVRFPDGLEVKTPLLDSRLEHALGSEEGGMPLPERGGDLFKSIAFVYIEPFNVILDG